MAYTVYYKREKKMNIKFYTFLKLVINGKLQEVIF